MNVNPEREFQRKFAGNILFYRDTSFNRPSVFLERNLIRFLHYHRYKSALRVRKFNIPKQPGMSSSSELGQMVKASHQPIRPSWSMGEICNKLEKGITGPEAPILKIDLTSIRDRKAIYRNLPEQRPSLKRIRTTSVHAQCLLTIWPTGSSKKEDSTYLVKQSKSCVIEAGTKESGERTATITMESPFFVKFEELLITGRKPLNGYSTQLYDMQLTLLPANATDPWPPLDFSAPPPRISQRIEAEGPVRFPMLLAQWRKLPQLPETGVESLLEGLAYQDGKRYKTKLSLKLEAAWSSPSSPLISYNASRRRALSPVPHLPSPVSDHDTLGPIISVTWIFQGLWEHIPTLELDGYLCPLCQKRQSESMDTYDFHLATSHDLFKFRIVSRTSSAGTRRKIDVEVLVDVTDTFSVKSSSNVLDQREMNWQKPQTLFDLQAFLKGDETWVGKENKSNTRPVPPRPILLSTPSNSGDSAQNDIPITVQSRAAKDVPDLPHPDRKKFAVPAAPQNIKFFRLTVKRPLREGEYISESDDDMDGSWLIQKHNDTIGSFSDISAAGKQFIQLYDRHMLDENLSSNLHFREALVRFCRLNRDWLQKRDMNIEFYKNAARLLMQGLISPQLYRDCANIIGAKQLSVMEVTTSNTIEDESQKTLVSAKRSNLVSCQGTALNAKSPDLREKPRSPAQAVHLYGECFQCSFRIYSAQKIIRCSGIDCNAPEFHLKCIGLSERIRGWLCPACERSLPKANESSSDPVYQVARRGQEGIGHLRLRNKGGRKEVPGSSQSSDANIFQTATNKSRQGDGSGKTPQEQNRGIEISDSDSDESMLDDSPDYRSTNDDDPGYEDVDDESSDQEHDLMMSEEERMLEDDLDEGASRTKFLMTRSAGSDIMDEGT